MAQHTVAASPRKILGYIRRSQDSGSGVSEEIQRDRIEGWAHANGYAVTFLPPDLDESSQTLNRPGMKKALDMLASGEWFGIVADTQDRFARNVPVYYSLLGMGVVGGWRVFAADGETGGLLGGVKAVFAQEEYDEKLRRFNAARRNAVENHGVHGGDRAPLGYTFSVRGTDKKGRAQRGCLVPNADAPKIAQAHEAIQSGAPWSTVVRILGVSSPGAARNVLLNRVYVGEARSGTYVKPGAHDALVTEECLRRTAHVLSSRAGTQKPAKKDRVGGLLAGGILRCAGCGGFLTYDESGKVPGYRCKRICAEGHSGLRPSIAAKDIEAYALSEAIRVQANLAPLYAEKREDISDRAEALGAALVERDEIEAAEAELSALAYAKAWDKADAKVTLAERALADAEASRGWQSMSTESVQKRVLAGDVAVARDFVKEIIQIRVSPVGRGKRVPVASRIEVKVLAPLLDGVEAVTA